MNTTRLGCISSTGIIATLAILILIGGVAFTRGGVLFNPGELNAQAGSRSLGGVSSHAELGGRCAACHTAFWQREKMADRCLTCHADLIDSADNFHRAMLAQSQTWECFGCHTDHNGAEASMNIMDLERFPHQAVGFSLQGHRLMTSGVSFACSDCHGEDISRFNQATCTDCHRQINLTFLDEHLNTFGQDCLACHDGVDIYGDDFDHNLLVFPLQGKHATTACSGCHTGAGTPADLKQAPQACFSCHAKDDAHEGRFGQNCEECHTPSDWESATFDHSLAAFQLTGAHTEVTCENCHINEVFKGTPQDCFSCHAEDDAHEGRFGQNCQECHTTGGWEEATFDHNRAAFQLTGAHTQVPCENCHINDIFLGTPQDCFSCHAQDDAHEGQFGQNCQECHTTDGWEGATFNHTLAAFPLTGAHTQVECVSCHREGVFKGTHQECSACHAEPTYHLGLFDANCAGCHTTGAWRPAAFDQPHTFPFNHGETGSSDCRVCHPDTLTHYTCYTCHEHNPARIESEHREEGISDFGDCARCHPTGREEEGEGGGSND